jgi:hypothetical protein
MIFDNQWAYGFTNEASLENFQKVKEVVGNAIKTAIAKIKELIKRFMDWIKGSKADDREKIDVTIENANEAKRKFGALFVNPDVARAIAGIITLIRTYSAALSSVSKITSKYRSLLMTLRSDMEGIISKIGQILDKK